MTAIGYVRRSKESGDRTVSLEDQRARIAAYCVERDWSLAETLSDDGVSGGNREHLERLAEQVEATGARAIVVYHLDRFARDLAATLDYLRRFARRGVELHVVGRGKVEADTASGFIVTAVEGLAAEQLPAGDFGKDAGRFEPAASEGAPSISLRPLRLQVGLTRATGPQPQGAGRPRRGRTPPGPVGSASGQSQRI